MAKALILTGITGTRVGLQTALAKRSTVIGSSPTCDIILHDRQVLPRHAEIRQVLDRWFVVPLDTGSRIFVNGNPVTSQGRLLEGDLVTVGSATFKASLSETSERAIGR
ncbi:FHA domain-containing protein [Candidatus Gracilibacteria bacterium]|nr:FHA domain-containing protein [Candidatus Gracilibacteria bacterium]